MGDIYAIGDIHGNLRALEQVIERSPFNPETDELIGLGDYIDGHQDSALVVEYLLNLPKFTGIRGNHDCFIVPWLESGKRINGWINLGGKATIESYIRERKSTDPRHLKFFKDLQDYMIIETVDKGVSHKSAFVHGGWTSKKGLEGQQDEGGTFGRTKEEVFHWDRDLWDKALDTSFPVYSEIRTHMYDDVFIGHTNTIGRKHKEDPNRYKPEKRGKIWNLDQGAGGYGKLTLMNIRTKEYWQSDTSDNFYKFKW